jgi:acyl dehydratase
MVELTLAELPEACPVDLGATDWTRLTQERIDGFAAATGDRQWIHVDPERARREAPAGTTIAHGMLTLSLVPGMIPLLLNVSDAGARLNYGLEQVRFLAPVPRDGELRLRATLAAAEPRGDGVLYRVACELELRGAERPAAVATFLSLARPSSASA